MKAELKDLGSPDLDRLGPPHDDDFHVVFIASIGMAGETGEELFQFVVASPTCLRRQVEIKPQFLRHTLLMESFDVVAVRRVVEELCDSATGADWKTIAGKLSRFMHWEFEDYRGKPTR